jgi:beta-phosphoglucomutase
MMVQSCRIDVERYKAILFDMDGVITDTMKFHYEAYRQAFEPLGISLTPLDVYLSEGMPSLEVGKVFVKKYDISIGEEQLKNVIEQKRELYRKLAAGHVQMYPGVKNTIDLLRDNGIKLALVSGSNRISVMKVLDEIGMAGKFDAIVTGADTERGKPYPDPYVKAMNMLGITGENSVVVENAPLGIESAKAAGIDYVIAVTTTLPEQYLREADDIMPSFTDIEDCLARRFKEAQKK